MRVPFVLLPLVVPWAGADRVAPVLSAGEEALTYPEHFAVGKETAAKWQPYNHRLCRLLKGDWKVGVG